MKFQFHNLNKFDLDSPERTIEHKKIIYQNYFLKNLYSEWYTNLKSLSNYKDTGTFLELGSGGGFAKEIMPNLITSDILKLPECDLIVSAESLPFDDESIDGIIMIDVFHHLSNVDLFLGEASRVLDKNGLIVLSEPWNSKFGRFIYQNFHHEPFLTKSGWTFPQSGPLSSANGALPWIVFERDIKIFNSKFPHLKIKLIKHHTPIRYLVSGGVSYPQLLPNFLYKVVTFLDHKLESKHFCMFAYIVIQKEG